MTEYLYCIVDSSSQRVKLGYSRDPHSRLVQLRTGTVEDLQLAHTIAVPLGTGRAWERVLHSELRHRQLVREWYAMPVSEAVQFMMWFEIHHLN